jgi:hypothetical protein
MQLGANCSEMVVPLQLYVEAQSDVGYVHVAAVDNESEEDVAHMYSVLSKEVIIRAVSWLL